MGEDSLEVLNGNVWDGDSSGGEVCWDKFGEGLLVELGFQLLQELCEFYVRKETKRD